MRDGASLHLWSETDGSTHYSVDLGAGGGSAHCSVYEDHTPILAFWHAGANVTISPGADTHVSDSELRFAQDVADMAADYLAACKRFHTPDIRTANGGATESQAGRAV